MPWVVVLQLSGAFYFGNTVDQSKISNHFSWHEALYLPTWSREATEADGLNAIIRANLVVLFSKMDQIRDHFNKPIIVHVAYRSEAYNKLIGGAPSSVHMQGMACDFNIEGLDCDAVRQDILDNKLLETLGMRMEHLDGSNWVHLDIGQPHPNRYFIP